MRDKVVQNP